MKRLQKVIKKLQNPTLTFHEKGKNKISCSGGHCDSLNSIYLHNILLAEPASDINHAIYLPLPQYTL
jgi:hypothetical protein